MWATTAASAPVPLDPLDADGETGEIHCRTASRQTPEAAGPGGAESEAAAYCPASVSVVVRRRNQPTSAADLAVVALGRLEVLVRNRLKRLQHRPGPLDGFTAAPAWPPTIQRHPDRPKSVWSLR